MLRASRFQTSCRALQRRALRVTLSSNFGDDDDAASLRSDLGTEGRVKGAAYCRTLLGTLPHIWGKTAPVK